MDATLEKSLIAGVTAGFAGLAFFFTLHWFLLFPIIDLLFLGLVLAPIAGLVVGWAFDALDRSRGLPRRPFEALFFGAALFVSLLPAVAIAAARGPVDTRSFTTSEPIRIVAELLLAFPMGGFLGLALTRERAPAFALGIASLSLAFLIGHNVPLLGGSAVAPKMLAVILATELFAAVVLAEVRRHLLRKPPPA